MRNTSSTSGIDTASSAGRPRHGDEQHGGYAANRPLMMTASNPSAGGSTEMGERAVETGAANAVLVRPNQAGTMTRAIDIIRRATETGTAPVVSARSGETCDRTIADLAVALDAGQIKGRKEKQLRDSKCVS